MAILSDPFADFFNVSFPSAEFDAARDSASEVLHAAGGYTEREGVLRLGDGGVAKLARKFNVGTISVSGAALSALREQGLFRPLLGVIAEVPHRVTVLHATVDVAQDGATAVQRVWRRANRGSLAFTRKAIPRSQVRRLLSAGVVDARQTGTVYLGDRRRDVSAKVYDKRQQLLQRAIEQHGDTSTVVALNDPGPLTRYELQLGRHVGVTLQDVDAPASVFWHHVGGVLLPRPDGVAPWQSHSEGFVMPVREETNYVRQLDLLLENSPDVSRMMELADKISPKEGVGRRYLFGKLRRFRRQGERERLGVAVPEAT